MSDETMEIDSSEGDYLEDEDLDIEIERGDIATIEQIARCCSAVSFRCGFVHAMMTGRADVMERLVDIARARQLDVDRLVGAGFGPTCEMGVAETIDALARLGLLGAWPTAPLVWDASFRMLRQERPFTPLDAVVDGHTVCTRYMAERRCGHAVVAARLLAAGAVPTTPVIQLIFDGILGDGAAPALARWEGTPELAAALEGVPGYRIGYDAGYRAGRFEAAPE